MKIANKMKLYNIHRDYDNKNYYRKNLDKNPFKEFAIWIQIASSCKIVDLNAMILSTIDYNNQPDARVVLLRHFSNRGFVFYTNYNSKKGKDINNNNNVSATLFWPILEKQIRIKGIVSKTSYRNSNNYFLSRPKSNIISTIISHQSKYIKSIDKLDLKWKKLFNKINYKIECPKYWGGYLIKPYSIEFWQGRPNRLHKRIIYIKKTKWTMKILSP